MAIKFQAKGARRALRYKGGKQSILTDEPQFDSFTLEIGKPKKGKPDALISAITQKYLGKDWSVFPVKGNPSGLEFDILPPENNNPDISEAWELLYRLRKVPEIIECEIAFNEPQEGLVEIEDRGGKASGLRASSSIGGTKDKLGTEKYLWSIKNTRVDQAWELTPPAGGRSKGEGILIGHPDSGFISHKELDANRLRTDTDWDFYENDENPEHLDGNHGLGTASVIMSGDNKPNGDPVVYGVAPKAHLMPLRVTKKGVILLFAGPRRLRDAIDYAVAHGCHVISISLGGLPNKSLKEAVRRAVSKDVIILAAAGNRVITVAWPARYDKVIAVAASNINDEPWKKSSRGSAVDISAPGESVWKAAYKDGETVVRSHGTSFAVATTAGIVALWLAYHGRLKLIAHYGQGKLAEAFKDLLVKTCRQSATIKPGSNYGAGIVDAHKLLTTNYKYQSAVKMKKKTKKAAKNQPGTLEDLKEIFPEFNGKEINAGLMELFGATSEKELNSALDQLGNEFLFHIVYDKRFHANFKKKIASHKEEKRKKRGRLANQSGERPTPFASATFLKQLQ